MLDAAEDAKILDEVESGAVNGAHTESPADIIQDPIQARHWRGPRRTYRSSLRLRAGRNPNGTAGGRCLPRPEENEGKLGIAAPFDYEIQRTGCFHTAHRCATAVMLPLVSRVAEEGAPETMCGIHGIHDSAPLHGFQAAQLHVGPSAIIRLRQYSRKFYGRERTDPDVLRVPRREKEVAWRLRLRQQASADPSTLIPPEAGHAKDKHLVRQRAWIRGRRPDPCHGYLVFNFHAVFGSI
ncbi:hypothetical protein OPV22_031567 [Ensete ventricosum]|uniref:Uncharacterized protein n=1 Tax=Ensete ventricosum TaxID=4639 RepID=A0AAV8PL00_ENSVE|nr:hypothetical protein OPV22_031567 [Ensete ventricosum]